MPAPKSALETAAVVTTRIVAALLLAGTLAATYNTLTVQPIGPTLGLRITQAAMLGLDVLLPVLIWRGRVWPLWLLTAVGALGAAASLVAPPPPAQSSAHFDAALATGGRIFLVFALVIGAVAALATYAGRKRA